MTIDELKKNIAPYMRKGWVAMDKDGCWSFYEGKPSMNYDYWGRIDYVELPFDIEPVDNWKESLIEVGK